jgi:hypothetical protein
VENYTPILMEKSEGKTTCEKPCRRRKDYIKIYLKYIRCGIVHCINLTEVREGGGAALNTIMSKEIFSAS